METSSSSLDSILEAAGLRSAGVVGNPYLAAGYLIGSSLLGLLVIIGVFWYHRSNLSLFKRTCIMTFTCRQNSLMGVQLIHRSLVTLLIVDALNLIVVIILGAEMVRTLCSGVIDCSSVEIVWFVSRCFGGIFHLLIASFSIYHLCQPLSTETMVRCAYILISVLIIIIVPLFRYVPKAAIFTLAAFMFLFALSVIVTSAVSTSSPSTSNLKKLIGAVAMCNFLVVYVPTFILQGLIYSSVSHDESMNYQIISANVMVFTNLHLIFDGLQCALVLKLPSGEEQEQLLGSPNPGYTEPTNVNE